LENWEIPIYEKKIYGKNFGKLGVETISIYIQYTIPRKFHYFFGI
jgi:hypothetical protein